MHESAEPPQPKDHAHRSRSRGTNTAVGWDGGVAVILNPKAGRGRAGRIRRKLERLLREHAQGTPWTLVETQYRGHARELAAEAAANGASVVAAGGGDGVVGEVVNGIVGTAARLGIVPLGTGNDLARDLGLAGGLNHAVWTLFHGTPWSMDLGKVDGWWFANGAGCGFDAVVAQRVGAGYRWLRGSAVYVAAVLDSLRTFRAANFSLEADGRALTLKAMLCYVANSCSTGGGMRIAPNARLDDGLLDLCILTEVGRVEFLKSFPRVFRGTHIRHPKVLMLQARDVRLATDPPLPVLADGDVIQTAPCRFTAVPAAVEVLIP